MRARSILLLLYSAAALTACGGGSETADRGAPVVLLGVDGASWNAIQLLWDQGELPHLQALAQRGVTAELRPVAAASPVIWTSIATGVRPERHGITNFVVPTDSGDVPVSSRARRVPAIWNMASVVERRVATLGWWASWPAEEIDGVLVSDRALRGLEATTWPPDFATTLSELMQQTQTAEDTSATRAIGLQDRAVAAAARHLASQGFDLLMVYLRNVDVQSHSYWGYFIPEYAAAIEPDSRERFAEFVRAAYREVDRVLGELVTLADPRTNFFVVSDHGFRAVKGEQHRVILDLDRVLEHFGHLQYLQGEIDWSQTRATSWDSPTAVRLKLVRLARSDRAPAGPVAPSAAAALLERLAADLNRVTYAEGTPAFKVRAPSKKEIDRGGDLTVIVRKTGVSSWLEVDGVPIEGAIEGVFDLTGTHDANTEGIFLASGPDIDPTATLGTVHSLDVTPTLLYAMGLPIARDFDGRPQLEAFSAAYRRRNPVRTIPTWGTRQSGEVATSAADAELMEELRALGYLD